MPLGIKKDVKLAKIILFCSSCSNSKSDSFCVLQVRFNRCHDYLASMAEARFPRGNTNPCVYNHTFIEDAIDDFHQAGAGHVFQQPYRLGVKE